MSSSWPASSPARAPSSTHGTSARLALTAAASRRCPSITRKFPSSPSRVTSNGIRTPLPATEAQNSAVRSRSSRTFPGWPTNWATLIRHADSGPPVTLDEWFPTVPVVICEQRPGARGAGLVVVPDGGGHGQDALGDADGDSFEGAAAVGFEVELAFEGVVDRFDELADRLEQGFAVPRLFVFAGRAQQRDAAGGQVGLHLASGEALVGDEGQPGPAEGKLGLDVEHRGQDLAFPDLGVC